MRILIPGGSGQVGTLLARHLHANGHIVTVLSRHPQPAPWRTLPWDGITPGPWAEEIHRSDAVIHLSGRSVNCRYNAENRRQIYDSRTLPTLLLGRLIAASPTPPRLWLNASSSTFYRNTLAEPNDEFTGVPSDLPAQHAAGGVHEPGTLPETWSFSADVIDRWESALASIPTPRTRKILLRTSMVMSPGGGGVFSVFSKLARLGLGGTQGPGTQYVSWIHDLDICRSIDMLLTQPEITAETNGVVNLCAPYPMPNREFMRTLRQAWHQPIGLPAFTWMLELGAIPMRTETELILKSRRVAPGVLLKHGFDFAFPTWPEAARNLVRRTKAESEKK
jgi:NAD dependent epimerase/dehydratase family enzyme